MASKVGEFKGHKVLVLFEEGREDDRFSQVTFGLKKAKLILDNIKDIEKFVEEG